MASLTKNAKEWICYLLTHRETEKQYVGITSQDFAKRCSTHKLLKEHGAENFDKQIVACGDERAMRVLERVLQYEWRTSVEEGGYNETGGTPIQIRYQLTRLRRQLENERVTQAMIDMGLVDPEYVSSDKV